MQHPHALEASDDLTDPRATVTAALWAALLAAACLTSLFEGPPQPVRDGRTGVAVSAAGAAAGSAAAGTTSANARAAFAARRAAGDGPRQRPTRPSIRLDARLADQPLVALLFAGQQGAEALHRAG